MGTHDSAIFIKTPRGKSLWVPLAVGLVSVLVLAVIGLQADNSVVIWVMVVVALIAAWWVRAKIWFIVGPETVSLRGPFFRRVIQLGDIDVVKAVEVSSARSVVRKPVSTDAASGVTRLDMGGNAAVILDVLGSEPHVYEFVVSHLRSANDIVEIVRQRKAEAEDQN